MHKLLERQLKRHFGSLEAVPPDLRPLLEAVGSSYDEADADRRLVERSLELTSQELMQRNADLRARDRERQIIFDSVPAMIFYKDRDNRILDLNAPAAAVMGRSVEELRGKATEDVLPRDIAQALHEDDLQVIRSEKPKLGIIEAHPDGQGKMHWVRTDKVPYRDDRGQVKGVIVLSLDITDRKAAEEAVRTSEEKLKDAYLRLQQVDKDRMQFLNNAAHELSTPLTPIRLQVHMLQMRSDILPEAPRKAVQILGRNFERLERLVRDLLDSSRLQAASLRLHRETLDLRSVLYQSVENYLAPAKEAGVALSVGDLPELWVDGDPERLSQVFDNLMSNALKFTPEGATVYVSATEKDGVAEVEVRDEGAGMRPADLGRLFQPFSQVHDTMQRTRGGTGLGLYVCRGIMEALGGTIEAHSDGLGQGATFTVRMPLAPPANQA